jgi:HD-GYP domain-containing protein (c-di-GMP phosphodiesterase class II)
LGARIVAVADAYDAIITDRPYRRGRPPWQAIEEIRKGSGTQFDPIVVEAFERVSRKYISLER